MKKTTLEAALLARRDDPRALRGAITFLGGKPSIVFGVVGDHRRFSIAIEGNKMTLTDDPRPKTAPKPENKGDGGDQGEGVTQGSETEPEAASEADNGPKKQAKAKK